MKKYVFYLLTAIVACNACNDDFLQRDPMSTQTVASLKVYDNFRAYSWGIYSACFYGGDLAALPNQTNGYTDDDWNKAYDRHGDEGIFSSGGNPKWAWNTVTTANAGGNWNFNLIRRVNIMLDAIDNSSMSQTEMDHWRAVGYFFRAYRYAQLIANFGDVPWLEHEVKTTDEDILYGPRTPRDQVATNILDNLTWAEQHIKEEGEGSGTNSINVHAVRVLISRFGLAEGTWRKYHKINGHEKYLDASITASEKLMTKYPTISPAYDALYNSESLAGVAGIILYKSFLEGQLLHNFSRYERTSSANAEMSKESVSSYLNTNGLPVFNTSNTLSPATDPDSYLNVDMYDEFRNRDKRLLYTVAPPFKLKSMIGATTMVGTAYYLTTKDTYSAANKAVTKADSTKFVEYINLMQQITSTKRTTGYQYPAGITYTSLLPLRNWEGNALLAIPHFSLYSEGRGFIVSRGGYFMYKYYNTSVNPTGQTSTNDLPIFRMGEVLLNYAEAKWEKGQFTQDIADQTINKLRDRAGVAHMTVADIGADFDLNRDKGGYVDGAPAAYHVDDYEVDPVLWEIRRERRVELMGDDGFRFNDLKRWCKGHYLNKNQLGVTVDNAEYNNALAIWPYDPNQGAKSANSNNKSGPIALAGDPIVAGKGWKWYYYLYPVPPTEIGLNPQLTQNPGWE